MTAKKTAPVVDRRSQQAIETFEKAMKAMGKHDYDRAREHFNALLEGFPEERDLLERARSYRAVCERALEKQSRLPAQDLRRDAPPRRVPAQPGRIRGGAQVPAPGRRDPPAQRARPLLHGGHRRAGGDNATALKSLRQAVGAGPANRAQARQDPDFDTLREDEEFLSILYPQAS